MYESQENYDRLYQCLFPVLKVMQRRVRILKCTVKLPVLRKYIKQYIMTKKRGCTEACHHSSNIHIDTEVIQAGISTVHTQQIKIHRIHKCSQ